MRYVAYGIINKVITYIGTNVEKRNIGKYKNYKLLPITSLEIRIPSDLLWFSEFGFVIKFILNTK